MATDSSQTVSGATQGVAYAGFWARFAALLVDIAILTIFGLVVGIASAVGGPAAMMIGQIVFFIVYLLYWPVMESSSRQATFGKSLLGIQVTDLDGARVSFVRAFLRNIAKIISSIPLSIGFLLAAFTARKQALHDIITKCLVVRAGPSHFVKAIAAAAGGLVIAIGCGAAYFYYVFMPQMTSEVAGAMQEAVKGAPAAKSAPATPPVPKAPPSARAADTAPKPGGAAADFDTLAGPALTGLEKPGTTRAGPAILELSTFFPTSIWVKVHLPAIKDLEAASTPEVTVSSVLDASGKNYYDAASNFEKGFFLRANLSSDSTSVPHISGLRIVQIKPGLSEQALQKVEGQVRIAIPVDAKPVAFEAGETGKEKRVHGAAVALKSLSGADAVLHYRGASGNLLGVRGYGKDGALLALEKAQVPPASQAVDMDLQIKFKGPVSKIETFVAASLVERQFPFSLVRGAVAGPPSSAATAAKPPAPVAPTAAATAPKPAAGTPSVAAAAIPEPAKPAPAAPAAAPAKSVAATPAPAAVVKMESEPKARTPRRRVAPPAAPPAPAPAVASAPAAEPRVITPKYNDVMTAVLYGDHEAVKQLLDLGWWVDKPSANGLTPLIGAVTYRDARMVQVLLAHGADPNARGPGGVTPLGLARDRNDTETSVLLQQRGAR